jgi:hypothetical protein
MSDDVSPEILHQDLCPLGFPEPDDEDIRIKRRREFRKNEDPRIDDYVRQPPKPPDGDVERYLKECHKYGAAPISLIVTFLEDPESVELDLSVSFQSETTHSSSLNVGTSSTINAVPCSSKSSPSYWCQVSEPQHSNESTLAAIFSMSALATLFPR